MAYPKSHITARIEERPKPYGRDGETFMASIALCGEVMDRGTHYAATETDLTKVSCRVCSAKRATQMLDALGDHGLSLHPFTNPGGYRDVYRHTSEIRLHGELVGFVGIEGGFTRQNWVVTTLRVRERDRETVEMGFEMEQRIPLAMPRNGETYRESKPRLYSKEAALVFANELLKEGRLKTEGRIVSDHKAWAARSDTIRAEMLAEEAEAARVKDETIAGLREIVAGADAGTIPLTNFQRAALENALLIHLKVTTHG